MKQLTSLAVLAVTIVLSASSALANGSGLTPFLQTDPFDRADAMVETCSGMLPLIFVVFAVVVVVLRQRDKRSK